MKKGVLKSFTKFTGEHLRQILFLTTLSKKRLAQVFSCEFCEISKNTIFTEQLRATASFSLESRRFNERSSHQRCSVKKVFLVILKLYRETPVLESLFNKVAGLRACCFIKKRLQHICLSVKFAKFLRTPVLKNSCERLLPMC